MFEKDQEHYLDDEVTEDDKERIIKINKQRRQDIVDGIRRSKLIERSK